MVLFHGSMLEWLGYFVKSSNTNSLPQTHKVRISRDGAQVNALHKSFLADSNGPARAGNQWSMEGPGKGGLLSWLKCWCLGRGGLQSTGQDPGRPCRLDIPGKGDVQSQWWRPCDRWPQWGWGSFIRSHLVVVRAHLARPSRYRCESCQHPLPKSAQWTRSRSSLAKFQEAEQR